MRVVIGKFVGVLAAWMTVVAAHADSPFGVLPKVDGSASQRRLEVRFEIPEKHVLYADKLSLDFVGGSYSNAFTLPASTTIIDKITQHEKRAFVKGFVATSALPASDSAFPLTLEIHLQGCDEANCFFPEERRYKIASNGTVTPISDEEPAPADPAVATAAGVTDWKTLAEQFSVVGRGSGYLNEKAFIEFLQQSETGQAANTTSASFATGWSAFLSVLVILLGGMALNLTPCVLPLIPINLAIIGAGSRAGSRTRGFALGGAYAAGMALAYGILGLVVVLTGSKFGTLNSSPWFNLVIGAVFVVLALGMFDKINIDFSRVTGGSATRARGSKGSFVLAYSMGTIAALLAGACVAPVVISVLLQATKLYAAGVVLGLALPFILGLGMALPWPFLGAGLTFLPKPGGWMSKVKYGFGGLIAVFAAYYFYLAIGLFQSSSGAAPTQARTPGTGVEVALADPSSQLTQALTKALETKQPVFIDFWASWCKNCSAMEHSTFQNQNVKTQLSHYSMVRLQAEKPNQQPVKPILDYFGAMGLPTYVVLIPKGSPAPKATAAAAIAAPGDSPLAAKRY